jgi:phosphoribosyl-ATP pyrophosphohydrolase
MVHNSVCHKEGMMSNSRIAKLIQDGADLDLGTKEEILKSIIEEATARVIEEVVTEQWIQEGVERVLADNDTQ